MKELFFSVLCLMCAGVGMAQVPAETNIDKSGYPMVLPDNRIEFRIKAPTAQSVQIDLGRKYDMTKDAGGVWSVTTDVQGSGIHYYSLIVDGVSVADPASESFYGCSRMMSCIEVPYAPGDNRFEVRDVKHGDVRTVRYFSKVTGKWRVMYVYTPAGYDNSTENRYPVLYIMHGGGEDARGWVQQGRTDIIMDNLIADGLAVPMLVVSFDANVGGFDHVNSEILDNVVPFIEKTFRVDARADRRALSGLSMGGMYTLYTGVPNTDKFHYLGVFSSGWFAQQSSFMNTTAERDANYSYMGKNASYINANLKKFWIAMGGHEDIAYANCQIMMQRMKQMGVKFDYYESAGGGHTWPVWREDLYLFSQMLFK